MRCSRPIALSLIVMLWAFVFLPAADAESVSVRVSDMIDNGGYILSAGGKTLAQLNPDSPFIPASTIKIATAFTALELLGPSHQIKTEFYLRNKTLCIKGYGDPYLISEQVAEIAGALKHQGLVKLNGIILDDSYFRLEESVDGAGNSANPYDALNSALTVNFNSLPLTKYESGVVVSPEPQTPVLDITRDVASQLEPGLHRVNVSAFTRKNKTITPHRYFFELFSYFLRQKNISVQPSFSRGLIRSSDQLLYTYLNPKTIAEMIRGCLKFSNNFIANQLFLYSGAQRFGPPATWVKARKTIRETLETTGGIDRSQFTIVEGSGLSRKNRITPAAMITLLEAFKPYASLLSTKEHILLKSGTMTGVHGYAGYFGGQKLDPFVILLNQETNTRKQLLMHLSSLYKNSGLLKEQSVAN